MTIIDVCYVVVGPLYELDTVFSTLEAAEDLVDNLEAQDFGKCRVVQVPFVYYEGEFK